MNIKPLSISAALREPVRLLLFQPGDPLCPPGLGFTRLQELALHQPVYLVRLEQGRPVRVLRGVPFDQLFLTNLLPHTTAYAAAFRAGGTACLMLVARSPLDASPRMKTSKAFVPLSDQMVHAERRRRKNKRSKRKDAP
jgi:hypothetical protein